MLGFPHGSAGKESTCNAGDLGSNPGLGRSPGEGKGYLLQYSGLENSTDCIVHGVVKSGTHLSDFHFLSLFTFMFPLVGSDILEIILYVNLSHVTLELLSHQPHELFLQDFTGQALSVSGFLFFLTSKVEPPGSPSL